MDLEIKGIGKYKEELIKNAKKITREGHGILKKIDVHIENFYLPHQELKIIFLALFYMTKLCTRKQKTEPTLQIY